MRYFLFVSLIVCAGAISKELNIIAVEEPPAAFINDDNQQDGYVLDIVKAMQKVLDNHTTVQFIPEARALNIMSSEANTLLMSISRIPSRESKFLWIAHVLSKKWQVFTLTNSDIIINSLNDLRTLPSLGVVRGDVREEWLVNRNFKNLNSVTLHKQNIQMLALGRVSAIVYEPLGLLYQGRTLGLEPQYFKTVFTLNQADVYLVMSIHSPSSLQRQWQQAFDIISDNGELLKISLYWQDIIYKKFNVKINIEQQILVF